MKPTALRITIALPCLLPIPSLRSQTHVLATPEDAHWHPTTMLPAGLGAPFMSSLTAHG